MSYKNYLSNIITWATVTDELNYERHTDEVVLIIKDLAGNNYRDTVVKTIQLEVHTDDVATTKALLETFAKTYNNTDYTDDFDYVKQFYATPMVMANFNISGNNYSSVIVVSGTLIISSNVSDIKTVIIDGELYETTSRILTYTTVPDNQAVDMNGTINTTQIRNGILRFTCNLVSRGDTLTQKIKNIRRGNIVINTTFTIRLTFTDNDDVETHTMRLDSSTVNSNNSSLPTLSLTFIK